MKLTRKEHGKTLERYGHVKPARRGAVPCASTCPGTVHTCSLERGHRGPHVAHGTFRRVVAVWDGARGSGEDGRAVDRGAGARIRAGLRSRRSGGILEGVRDFALAVGSSLETVLFLVLLVGFVAFAVYAFLLFTGALL